MADARPLEIEQVGQEQAAVHSIGPHRQAVELVEDGEQPPLPVQFRCRDSRCRTRAAVDDPGSRCDRNQPGTGLLSRFGADELNLAFRAAYPDHGGSRRCCGPGRCLFNTARIESMIHRGAEGHVAGDRLGDLRDPGVRLLDDRIVEIGRSRRACGNAAQLRVGQALGDQDAVALFFAQRKQQLSRLGPQHVLEIGGSARIADLSGEDVHRAAGHEPEFVRVGEPDREIAAAAERFALQLREFAKLFRR